MVTLYKLDPYSNRARTKSLRDDLNGNIDFLIEVEYEQGNKIFEVTKSGRMVSVKNMQDDHIVLHAEYSPWSGAQLIACHAYETGDQVVLDWFLKSLIVPYLK